MAKINPQHDYFWSRPSKDPEMAQNWDTISDTTNMEAIQPKFEKSQNLTKFLNLRPQLTISQVLRLILR